MNHRRLLTVLSISLALATAPASAANVLMVVDQTSGLTSEETARVTTLQGWGHTVAVIEDGDSQANYDVAVAAADVVYVPEEIKDSDLGFKVREAIIGVVWEEPGIDDQMGAASLGGEDNQYSASINITDNSHAITSSFSTGSLVITTAPSIEMTELAGTVAVGYQSLAEVSAFDSGLGVIEVGTTLANNHNSSDVAFGRRVRLPFGAPDFEWSTLNSSGLQIVENAVAWASGGVDDPVLHFKLDETSGTSASDSSSYALDGTVSGSPSWETPARRSTGLTFETSDGADRVTGPNLDVVGDELTLAVWFKQDQLLNESRLVMHSSGNAASQQGWGLVVDDSGAVEFRINAGGTFYRFILPTAVEPGDWHHLVGVYDSGAMRIYLDGALVASGAHSVGGDLTSLPSATLTVGDSPIGSRPFDGDLDDVRVYGRALDAAEIAEVFGLIAHWKLDEASGAAAVDSSLSGHDATLTGSATWTGGKDSGAHESDYTDGTDDYFEAPSTTALDDAHESNYTVMAYFKPNSVPPGSGSNNNASYGILIKEGNHLGLHYNASQQFQIDHLNSGGSWNGAEADSTTYPPGTFYHVAGVVDYDAGTIDIYVDGVLAGMDTFTPGSAPQDYGTARWRLGIAAPGSSSWRWPADGVIDDARIYNRALSADEISQYASTGLIGHWKLTETSGTTTVDSGPGGADGTYESGVALDQGGPYPGVTAPVFDGANDHVELPAINANFQNGLTIAAWIQPDATLGSGQFYEILDLSNGSEVDQILFTYNGAAGLQLFLTDTADGSSIRTIEDNAGFTPGQWVHCVATVDASGNGTVYRDGKVTKSGFFTSLPTAVSRGTATIGKSSFGDHFGGGLQDVRLYNYELTPAEINEIYGLVGDWDFDEGTGTTAAEGSGNASDAAFNTGTPVWIVGVRGYALEFDGTNDAETTEPVDPPERASVTFWFRSDGTPAGRQRPWGSDTNFEAYQDTDGILTFDTSTDGDDGGVETIEPLVSAGRWYHCVVQYDATDESYEVYLDGVLHKSGISTWPIVDVAANNLSFGTRTGSIQRFTGGLDEFQIYNRWLSQAEIAELYGLVGWWRMEEGSGNTVADSSGAGNHGAFVGTGGWSTNAKEASGSIQLDGTNYVEVPGVILKEGSATVAGWARLTNVDDYGSELISLGNHFGIRIDSSRSGQGSYGYSYQGSSWDDAKPNIYHEGTGWHHFVMVADELNAQRLFYIDGVLQASVPATGSLTLSGQDPNTTIGSKGSNYDFTGQIDDVRVYNRAITREEVRTLFYGEYVPGLRIVKWVEVANP